MYITLKKLPPVDPHIVNCPQDYNMGAEAQFNSLRDQLLDQGYVIQEESQEGISLDDGSVG